MRLNSASLNSAGALNSDGATFYGAILNLAQAGNSVAAAAVVAIAAMLTAAQSAEACSSDGAVSVFADSSVSSEADALLAAALVAVAAELPTYQGADSLLAAMRAGIVRHAGAAVFSAHSVGGPGAITAHAGSASSIRVH